MKLLVFAPLFCISAIAFGKLIPVDSVTFRNDSCFYHGAPFTGSVYRGENFVKKYRKGVAHGVMKQWFANSKQLQCKSRYKRSKMHGIQKSWNREGVLLLKHPTSNGRTNGTQKEWRDDGSRKRWTSFKPNDTVKTYFHGIERDWNKEGIEITNRKWVNNQLHGRLITRYDNGNFKIRTTYKNGRLNGKYQSFYENGNPKVVARLEMGEEKGIKRVFKEEGSLFNEVDNSTGNAKYFHEDGSLSGTGKLKEGKQHGVWKWYYANGKEIVTLNYQEGIRVGIATFYKEDGAVDRKVEFVDNKEVLINE